MEASDIAEKAPGGQEAQAVSCVMSQADVTYVPGWQTLHTVQEAAFAALLKVDPAMHPLQMASEVTLQSACR